MAEAEAMLRRDLPADRAEANIVLIRGLASGPTATSGIPGKPATARSPS
jgi:hypothetical protein